MGGLLIAARGLSCLEAGGISVPSPGTELTSPALEAGFPTTRPPGKSLPNLLRSQMDAELYPVCSLRL